jgi:Domain of unknown function DUF11
MRNMISWTRSNSERTGRARSLGRRFAVAVGLTIGGFAVSASAGAAAPTYTFATFSPPDASFTLNALNSSGDVAGYYRDSRGFNHGYVRTAGTPVTVDVPGFGDTALFAMNDSGDVAGITFDARQRGFIRIGGTFTTFDPPDSIITNVRAMNSSGDVAGDYVTSFSVGHGFTRVGGTIATLDPPGSLETNVTAMNNSGDVAGHYRDSTNRYYGFVRIGGTFTTFDAPDARGISVRAMNNSGDVAGDYSDRTLGATHGFTRVGGTVTTFDPPDSIGMKVTAMNSSGDVAGWYVDHAPAAHGFVRIGGIFTTIDGPGSNTFVNAMNDAGALAGGFVASGTAVGFVAVPGVVGPQTQTVSFTSPPPTASLAGGATYVPTAVATSALPVRITVDAAASSVCSLTAGAVSFQAAGTCVLNANQSGNSSFLAAPQQQQSFEVFAKPIFEMASPPLTGSVGQMYGYTFLASGSPTPAYSLAVGGPSWLSISNGIVSGSPPAGTTSFTYSVTAANSVGEAMAGPFTVAVTTPPPPSTKSDLSVSLSCPATAKVAVPVTCSLVVRNSGPAAASKVRAVMTVPDDSRAVSVSGGGVVREGIAIWMVESLAANSNATFTVTYTPTRAKKVTIRAATAAASPDPNWKNNVTSTTQVISR